MPIDLAKVNGERYFINMATGGFGTRITTETPEKLKSGSRRRVLLRARLAAHGYAAGRPL